MRTNNSNVIDGSSLETRNIKARVIFNMQTLDYSNIRLINDDEVVTDEAPLLHDNILFPYNYPASLELNNLLLDGSRITTNKVPQETQNEYKLKYYTEGIKFDTNTGETITEHYTSDEDCNLIDPKTITINTVYKKNTNIIKFINQDTETINGIYVAFDLFDNNYATDFDIKLYCQKQNLDDSGVIVSYGDKELVQTINVTNNTESFYQYIGDLPVFNSIEITFTKINKPFQSLKISEIGLGIKKVYQDEIFNLSLTEEIDIALDSLPSNSFKMTVEDIDNEFDNLNPKNLVRYINKNANATLQFGILNNGWHWVDMGTYFFKDYTKNSDGSVTFQFRGIEEIEDDLLISNIKNTNNFLSFCNNSLINTRNKYNDDTIKFTSDTVDPYGDYYNNKLNNVVNPNIDPENIPSIREWLKYMQSAVLIAFKPYAVGTVFYTKFIDLLNNKQSGYTLKLDDLYEYPTINYKEQVNEIDLKGHTGISGKDTDVVQTYSKKLDISGRKVSIDNPYWNGSNKEEVGNYIMYNLPNTTITCNWRGCPAIEIGDWVDVETRYNTLNGIVTKQEFTFNGALKCKTEISCYSKTGYIVEEISKDTPTVVEDDGSQGTANGTAEEIVQ